MKRKSKAEISQELWRATNSSEALNTLYVELKDKNKKYSLSFFCERAGIASKGYLSEVLRGKKVLNRKYSGAVAKAFFLTGPSAEYFKVLVDLDHETDPSAQAQLAKRKRILAKSLKVRRQAPMAIANPFFTLNVYATLGLFGNRASFAELAAHFDPGERVALTESLQLLESSQLITKVEDKYEPVVDGVLFTAGPDRFSHIEFLHSCLDKTKAGLQQWYQNKTEAYFESSLISVDKKNYEELLPKMRAFADEIQSQMETPQADQVVLFSWNVFPVGTKRDGVDG